MPRIRYVTARDGIVSFSPGVPEDSILDMLLANKIQDAETFREATEVRVKIPPTENVEIPDHVYVWVNLPKI